MRILLVILGLLASIQIRAQSKEPWQRWADRRAEAPVWTFVNVAGSTQPTLTVGTFSASAIVGDCNTLGDTNIFIPQLRPNTEYTLTISGGSFKSVQISFAAYEPQLLLKAHNTKSVPRPYKVFINGVEQPEDTPLTWDAAGSCGSFSKSWKIEVRPDRGLRPVSLAGYEEEWRRDEDDVSNLAPGDGFPLEIGPGISTDPSREGFRWAVNMGRLWSGNTAGMIRFQELSLGASTYTAAPLSFTARSVNTAELNVILNASGQLRQIRAPQGLVDIQAANGECDLKFYLLSQVGSTLNGSGLYPININSPFVTWRIKNPDGTGAGTRLQLIEERPGRTSTSEISYNSTTKVWSLTRGSGSDLVTESRTISFSGSDRIETVDLSQGATSAYKAVETYHPYVWGWELTNVVTGAGTAKFTNSFDFYTDSSDLTSYGKLKFKRLPTGDFESWLYTPFIQRVLKPFQDSPATPEAATIANSLYRRMNYASAGTPRGEVLIDEFYGPAGTPDGETLPFGEDSLGDYDSNLTYTYLEWTSAPDDPLAAGTRYELKMTGAPYTEIRSHYNPGNYLHDMPYYSRYPDGHWDFVEYSPGTYNPVSLSYVTDANGHDFIRRLWKSATGAADASYTGWNAGDVNGSSGVQLTFLKSTRETTVYRDGNAVYECTEVVTGADGSGNPTLALINQYVSTYDSLGHLITKVWIDPCYSNITRTIYSASWNGGSGDCELKAYEIDETGTRLNYTYDTLKRVTSVTQVGVTTAPYPSQVSISTNWTYDAFGRLLSETATAGTLTLSRAQTFDLAGRPTLQSGFDGISTNLTYSANGRIITSTTSGGLTRITETYLDGRTKSITGSAQVAEYYSYSITSDDFFTLGYVDSTPVPKNVTHVAYGSSGSPRWTEKVTDSSQRLAQERKPSGDGTVVTTSYVYYDVSMEVLYAIQSQMVSADGQPSASTTIFEYDPYFGTNLVKQAPWSNIPDRLQRSETWYAQTGNDWFLVTTNFLSDNIITTEFITDAKRQRLSGFSAGVASQTYQYDVHTNLTTITTSIDPVNKLVTEVTHVAQSSLDATTVSLNGLLQTASTASIATPTKYFYDALGRETSETDPLGFSTSKTYDSYGNVSTETDKTGAVTTYGYYASNQQNAGMLASVRSPALKYTRYDYNTRGQKTHTWGDVPYPEMRVYDAALGDCLELRTYQGGNDWTIATLPTSFGSGYNSTFWVYDAGSGLVTSKTDATGHAVNFAYYRNNEVKTRQSSRGSPAPITTIHWYDEYGEEAGKAYSDGTTTAVTNLNFNIYGMPQQVVDGSGNHALSYDYAGRLTNDAYGIIRIASGYSPVYGLASRIVLFNGTPVFEHDYSYDTYGRLSSVINGLARVNYGYLANSDLVQSQSSLNNGAPVLTTSKGWEYGGRLASILHTIGTTPFQSFAYTFDALQRRTRATLNDGSSWNFGYDDRDEVISGKRSWSDAVPVAGQQFEYLFDSIGNRTSSKAGGDSSGLNLRTSTYTPNALNEITAVNGPSAMDVLGISLTTAATTVNGNSCYRRNEYFRNELAVANSSGPVAQAITVTATQGTSTSSSGAALVPKAAATLSYDLDGNQTADSLWTYTWDAENRLVQQTSSTSLPTTARKKLVFQYDSQGRRTRKTVYAWGTSDWATTPILDLQLLYADWLMLAEADASSQILRSYTWGNDLSGNMTDAGGIGGLVNVTHYGPSIKTNLFVTTDSNGHVMALINMADSSIAARYEYAAFGETVRASGPLAQLNPFQRSNKYTDQETGFSNHGSRIYVASLGRWLGRDPIGEEGGNNLYAFVANHAGNSIDPNGAAEHHVATMQLARSLPNGAGTDVLKKFTIPVSDPHYYDAAHRAYNPAVQEFLTKWLAKNKITEAQFAKSAQLAEQFVKDVMSQPRNTQIGSYLSKASFIGGKALKAAVIVGGAFGAASSVYNVYAGGKELVGYANTYKQDVMSGADTAMLDLDAVDVAVAVQTMTGDYFVTAAVLDTLLQ